MSPLFKRRLLVASGAALAVAQAFVGGFYGVKLAWCVGAALFIALSCVLILPWFFLYQSQHVGRLSARALRVGGLIVGVVLVGFVGALLGVGIGVVLGGLCAGCGLTAMVAARAPARSRLK
jgi:hypothetical protein